MLGQAITLVESARPEDRPVARSMIEQLLPDTGAAYRVGITGVPGVGKSTLIEALGTHLTGLGNRVAVLAVDPSSARTGGSILGDKTRMQELARDPNAFIRPSPARGALGGVAQRTRETMLVCEAAGFDVVIVETVGVGQSETVVADIVDFFMVLMLAGGGDELQGIKRGILELADMIAVTKADGDNVHATAGARAEYERALGLIPPRHRGWTPVVRTCSALTGDGIAALWDQVLEHRRALTDGGEFEGLRRDGRRRSLWYAVREGLVEALRTDREVAKSLSAVEDEVAAGTITPEAGAARLLDAFRRVGPGKV